MKMNFCDYGVHYNDLMAKTATFKAYSVRSGTITKAKGGILKVWLKFM
jgi:hypothetical protein